MSRLVAGHRKRPGFRLLVESPSLMESVLHLQLPLSLLLLAFLQPQITRMLHQGCEKQAFGRRHATGGRNNLSYEGESLLGRTVVHAAAVVRPDKREGPRTAGSTALVPLAEVELIN